MNEWMNARKMAHKFWIWEIEKNFVKWKETCQRTITTTNTTKIARFMTQSDNFQPSHTHTQSVSTTDLLGAKWNKKNNFLSEINDEQNENGTIKKARKKSKMKLRSDDYTLPYGMRRNFE